MEKKKPKGMIRGKGGPTDDAIKTHLPIGSYVMPADSTKAAKGMMGLMGDSASLPQKPSPNTMPVNVSNGEMVIPPEQAQAIGTDNLNAFKEETHQPVPTAARDNAPELFLADGGEVGRFRGIYGQRIPKKGFENAINVTPKGPTMTTASPSMKGLPLSNPQTLGIGAEIEAASAAKAANMGKVAKGMNWLKNSGKVAGKFAAPATVAASSLDSYDRPTEDYNKRFYGKENIYSPNESAAMTALKDTGTRTMGVASDLVNNALFGMPAKLFPSAYRDIADKEQARIFNEGYADATAQMKAAKEASAASAAEAATNKAQQEKLQGYQRDINKGLPSNTRPAAQRYSEPKPPAPDVNILPTPASKKDDSADFQYQRTPAPERNQQQQEERDRLYKLASKAHLGAQNGQLTANQMNILAGLDRDDQNRAQRVWETDVANQAALQQAKIKRQDQETQNKFDRDKTNLAKNLQDRQFGLDVAKFNMQAEAAQPAMDAANNLNHLRQAYANETDPEKKALIGQSMLQWGGKAPDNPNDKSNWITGSGGSTVDAQGNTLSQGSVAINTLTGERRNFGMGGIGDTPMTTDGNGQKLVKGNRYKNADGTIAVFDGEKLVPVG